MFRLESTLRRRLGTWHETNHKQRLIVDAPLSTCHSEDSRSVHLCTGATLGSIEMEEGQVDIENVFCNVLLPEESIPRSGLPRIKARHFGLDLIEGARASGDTWVYPYVGVNPMDFTHALC